MVLPALGAVEGVQVVVVQAAVEDPLAYALVVEAVRAGEGTQLIAVRVRIQADRARGNVGVDYFCGLVGGRDGMRRLTSDR
jgi:hypothetical protein